MNSSQVSPGREENVSPADRFPKNSPSYIGAPVRDKSLSEVCLGGYVSMFAGPAMGRGLSDLCMPAPRHFTLGAQWFGVHILVASGLTVDAGPRGYAAGAVPKRKRI